MRIAAIVCAALLLLCGVRPAQANVLATSRLTLALTMNVTVDQNGADSDSKVQKIRFATKDYLAVVADESGNDDLKSLVLTRTTNSASDATPTSLLSGVTMAFLDSSGAPVGSADVDLTVTARSLSVDLGATFAAQIVSAVKDKTDGANDVSSRKDSRSESASWELDGGADDVTLDMIAFTTSTAKRRFILGTDQGLFFSNRTASIQGGFDADYIVGTGTHVDLTGVLGGTIKASAEKP